MVSHEDREKRIQAAAEAMPCASYRHDPTRKAELAAAFDAADRAVPVVSEAEVETDAERLKGAKVFCPECGRGLGDVIASILRQRGRFKAQRNEARKRAECAEVALKTMQARWSQTVEQSKQHVERARVETQKIEAVARDFAKALREIDDDHCGCSQAQDALAAHSDFAERATVGSQGKEK